jgi:hypothetical protein
MFRETHREQRLRPLLAGRDAQVAVRPLSLTVRLQKIINIKDVISQGAHDESAIIPEHAPSFS